MPPAEGEKRPEHRTAIIAAVIGLVGVLLSPLVPRIWDALFPGSRTPLIEEFSANPQNIRAGEKVLLRWRVKGADHVDIQPGSPEASIPGGAWEDRPGRSTQYILTASNRSGKNATRSVRVEVAPTSQDQPPGPEKGTPASKETVRVADLSRAEQLAGEWYRAIVRGDIEVLVALANPPFLLADHILTDEREIRKQYLQGIEEGKRKPLATQLWELQAHTVADIRTRGGG